MVWLVDFSLGTVLNVMLKSCLKTEMNKCQSPAKNVGQCSICYGSVPWVDLREHEAGCRLCYQSSEEEKEEKPKFAAIPTYQKRQSNSMQTESRSQKEKQDAPTILKMKQCPYCKERFPDLIVDEHSKDCNHRSYDCYRCGKSVLMKDKSRHERRDCTMRHSKKEESFDNESYSALGASGYTKEYEKRIKQCPYCNKKFPELMFADHQEACEERPYQCNLCLKMMPWRNINNHESKECAFLDRFKKVFPPSEGPKPKDVPVYKKSFEKDYLEKNFQTCPYCNNRIPEAKLAAHVQSCTEGKKPCHFCKEQVPVDEEIPHLQKCVARVEDGSGFQTTGGKRGKKKNKKGKQSEPEQSKGWLSEKFERATNFLSGKASTPTTKGFVQETYFSADVVQLPCEFCDELFPEYLIIEHQSGCRPDLVCLPNAADTNRSAANPRASPDGGRYQYTSRDQPKANPDEDRYRYTSRDQPKANPDGDRYRYKPRDQPRESPDEDRYRYTYRDSPKSSPEGDRYRYASRDPRNTGALPKRNRFHRDDADTKPGEYLSRNSPPSEGLDFYHYRSGVPDHRMEPDVVNQSKTAFKSHDKTQVNRATSESLDKKLHAKNSETQLFNFSSSSNNNGSSYQSKSPPSMFSRRDDSYSPTRQRYSEAQKTEIKAVGAERAERKGIHRITRDTLIGEGESSDTPEEYGTNYQIPRHSRNSDNMHDIKKDQYSAKFICPERELNIPFADGISVMVHPEQLNSSRNVERNGQELNDLTEDDAKNDETFGSNFDPRQPLPLSNDEENFSDSMEQFYDAEDDLRTSNRETVKCLRNGDYDQNIMKTYMKQLAKGEDEMIAPNDNRRSSSSASEKVVNCDCGNKICYCGIANRSLNIGGNNNFLEEAREDHQENSHNVIDSRRLTAYSNANRVTNLNAEERNVLNVENQQISAEVKKCSSKFTDWRSSIPYSSDSE